LDGRLQAGGLRAIRVARAIPQTAPAQHEQPQKAPPETGCLFFFITEKAAAGAKI